ncbi:CDP-alcohol phosphatidyltransferase family protein [Bifidobacterium sp. ESL0763]|uniref:CDP-alcohol phosphatidyltransferase family protein n=1 Tax=Bifidobacterium sp. ESL0763 TaxID=2983227 RepID=UPI0023F76F12|nr:CDP-alcohol phosphatidyltransferase family protein [Bifidobacterium sp. ESL0763]MDF7663830.1 CDP-alcohol phosphatidyltransferase family protein [Bifidobacterium sp. ESL0763]
MLERLRAPFKRLIAPVARLLAAMGLSADAVTVIGAVGTIAVAIATGVTGWLVPGSILMAILAAFDALDGSVALINGGGTKFGAFLDSTLDRIADWAVLLAAALYFLLHVGMPLSAENAGIGGIVRWVGIGATLYAMMTSFVTSYARARAESVGYEAKNGIATRSDRLVIVLVGMLITGIFDDARWLMAFLVILAVLGTITVIQRILEVRRSMKADGEV